MYIWALYNLWSGVFEWSLGVESWSGALEWHFGVAFWSGMKLDTQIFGNYKTEVTLNPFAGSSR